jgi:aminoglycoside phosphotransferase (APT) family kinase protein
MSKAKGEMNGDRHLEGSSRHYALVPFMKTLHSIPYPEANEHTWKKKKRGQYI